MKQITVLILFSCLVISTSYSQALSNDTVHWTKYRKLTWSDFKGDTVDIPGISGETMMVLLATYQKVSIVFPTKAKAVTVFDRKNSWMRKTAMTEDALKYYQTTFDLYEVYARKLRKEFKTTKFGLDPNKVFQEKYSAALNALSDRNKLLMKETKLGTDKIVLEKWAVQISAELKELEEYSSSE